MPGRASRAWAAARRKDRTFPEALKVCPAWQAARSAVQAMIVAAATDRNGLTGCPEANPPGSRRFPGGAPRTAGPPAGP